MKSAIHMTPKFGCKFFYERIVPYLTSMPLLSSMQLANMENEGTYDFRPVPQGGDFSFINCVIECLRHLGRCTGLADNQADHLTTLVRWTVLTFIYNDLQVVSRISPVEVDIIKLAVRSIAQSAGIQVGPTESTFTSEQLQSITDTISKINAKLEEMCPRKVTIPHFQLTSNKSLVEICDWNWYGRFRRDTDVEHLAGAAPVPPIMRPIEMTLVPEKVSNFHEVAMAMRHALNLCVLLANQRALVRNSYTLRVCLIQHLFVRVIPIPLPITSPNRESQCFWHAQPMRYETQADILRLLNMLCRHFATASLSVKSTRSGDAIRILTFSCMATICDAALRKIAYDIPSQSSLHYSGKAPGPVKPFGFDVGNFAEESEYLKFSSPETAAARTQVLDYFYQLKKVVPEDHMMFQWEHGCECGNADKMYIDQLCVQMGFDRGAENLFVSGLDPFLLDHYPEIAFFRDLVFMFKLVMVPTSDKLPELKAWMPNEAALHWNIDKEGNFVVTGFGRKLDCKQDDVSVEEQQVKQVVARKGFFSRLLRFVGINGKKPRCIPSQANPSILLGEKVDTEDDILHIRNLPDFDGTLGECTSRFILCHSSAN